MDFVQDHDNREPAYADNLDVPNSERSASHPEARPNEAATLTGAQAEALGDQIAEQGAHLDAATHRLLTDLRAFDTSGGWSRQGAMSCAHWLSWRLGWSGNRAREHVRVANCLGRLPTIDGALRLGEVSYCKVRAMTRVATPDNERLLLEDARHCTGNHLEKICQKYAMVQRSVGRTPVDDAKRRRITRRGLDDGMVGIEMVVTPDEAVTIWEALSKVARERDDSAAFSRVDAVVEICEGVVRGNKPDRSPTEIVVTIAAEVLDGSNPTALQVATTNDGTCVSAETARRLACDCGIVKVYEDERGTPVSVGRKTRSICASLKRALAKRDSTCRFPGCTNRQYVHGHHVVHWANGGETKLGNMVSLCSFHHMFVHEFGYRVELDENQQPHFFNPRGRVVPDVPPPSKTPELGTPTIHKQNQPLVITSSTNEPRWNGQPPNYAELIEDLARTDKLS